MKHYDKSNWKKVRLGDIGYFLSGAGFPIVYQGKTKGQIPFLKVSDFSLEANKDFLTKANNYISNEVREKLHASIIPTGAIVFAKIGAAINLERKRMNKLPICIDNNMMAFVPTGVSNDFICHVFQTITLSNFVSATALPSLSSKVLGNIVVMLPENLETQQRISNALVTINNHISNLERLISKQESIKKTTLKLLLEPKSDYNTVTLGDIVVLAKGEQLGKSQMDPSGEYMVMNGGITASGKTNKYNHLGNTITISEGGNSCGFVSFIKDNFWCGGHCYTLENLKVDTDYLYQLLKYREDSIMKLRVGSGLPNIPKNRLASLILAVINSKEHQKRIAAQLSEIDAHIENLKQQLAKQRAIKQGLMDYFFGN